MMNLTFEDAALEFKKSMGQLSSFCSANKKCDVFVTEGQKLCLYFEGYETCNHYDRFSSTCNNSVAGGVYE